MQQNTIFRCIASLALLFCLSISTAYAKVDLKFINITVQNSTGFASKQPARALSYSIESLGNNGHSGNLNGQIAPNTLEQISLWPLDNTAIDIGFNLIVRDPAANNRVIFNGQYYYDLLPDGNHRVSVMIHKSANHYYVIPTLESPTEQFTARAGIQIEDEQN